MPAFLVLILMIPILAIFLDSDLGKALARRLERGNRKNRQAGPDRRLEVLEAEVEHLSSEVRRLSEDNRFLNQLLEGRAEEGALSPGEREGGSRDGASRA